jgi:hypothetical protein
MLKKIILKCSKYLLILLVTINMGILISNFLIYLIKKNNKDCKKSEFNILVFEKPRFVSDIYMLNKYSEASSLILPINLSVLLGKIFLPEEIRGQKKYHKKTSTANQKKKLQYRSFLRIILPRIFNKLNIKSIVVGNLDYWEHQEWSWACKDLEIPTIVLYRESVGWEERNILLEKHYSNLDYKVPIDKLVVFGPETKKWMDRTNLINKNNIVFTGAPRTDSYYYEASKYKNIKDKKLIVLFDFISEKYSSSVTPVEVLEEFVKLANNHPNNDFLIKTKEDIYKSVLLEKIQELDLSTNNISIDSYYSFENVLKNAKIIIGYMRSTVMIESMIANAHIALPVWGDLVDEDKEITEIENNIGKIHKVKNRKELIPTIEKIISTKETVIPNEAFNIRDKYIYKNLYKIDGKSSERFFNVIKNTQIN